MAWSIGRAPCSAWPARSSPTRTTRRRCRARARTCWRAAPQPPHTVPAGTSASTGRVHHASAPWRPKMVGDVIHRRGLGVRVAAGAAVERGDGRAPQALARQHPVGAVRDHRVDAILAPWRHPLGGGDLGSRASARAGRRGRSTRTTAAWRGTRSGPCSASNAGSCGGSSRRPGVEQRAVLGQVRHDQRVGLLGGRAGERRVAEHHAVDVAAARVDGRVRVEVVPGAGAVVVGAVAGGGVDQAGALRRW
jgi:hypothetical protein